MFDTSPAFSSFSTDDVDEAHRFYKSVLGLDAELSEDDAMGAMLTLRFPGGGRTLVYGKDDHEPATHTVLMFPVADIDAAAAFLTDAGVELEHLEWSGPDGIARDPDGHMPPTAWFRDPAGNWLSLIEGDV